MKIKVEKSILSGNVLAPSSKSFAIRALICGAFTNGTTVNNVSFCDDVNAVISCLKTLGATVEIFEENSVKIGGLNSKTIPNNIVLDCKESATALRLLIPVCLTFGKKITFIGSKRLFMRNNEPYKRFCENNGFVFTGQEEKIAVFGNLTCGNYEIQSEFSSQFISGMLFALSLIDGKSTLSVMGDTVSKPYVNITKSVLNTFGACVREEKNVFIIDGKKILDKVIFTVEGDCSNSAYIKALSFLGGNIKILGINDNTLQGDIVYKKYFDDIKNGKREFSVKDCPDLAPILYSTLALLGGGTITDTNRLSLKESNRNIAMKEELSKFGIKLNVFDNYVKICPSDIISPIKTLSSHNDHRILMALMLLCLKTGGEIDGIECIDKSYNNYFNTLKSLGANYKIVNK